MSLVSFGYGVGISLEAAEVLQTQHGINCEVINLRTLRPLDTDSIVNSVKKTNHLVTIETGWPQCGIGSEIIAQVRSLGFFLSFILTIFRSREISQ